MGLASHGILQSAFCPAKTIYCLHAIVRQYASNFQEHTRGIQHK